MLKTMTKLLPLTVAVLLALPVALSAADPIDVNRDMRYELINLSEPTNNAGVELLGTWRRAPFSITGTYTYVRAREFHDGRRLHKVERRAEC